jgi:hypothetical protein
MWEMDHWIINVKQYLINLKEMEKNWLTVEMW